MKFEVEQGVIHVNSISVVLQSAEAIVLHVDCKHKYIEGGCGLDCGEDTFGLTVYATERTPGLPKDAHTNYDKYPPSHITVRGIMELLGNKDSDVKVLMESTKYGINIVFVKLNKTNDVLYQWCDDNTVWTKGEL
ncbi:MAG: hypothetical protein KGH64_04245 [Candidatus Micrarchaeota archaeon]|nr:hypothetical protein [Candidatus Micrarchaeota archaeon]